MGSSESESEDERRVVRSAKVKAQEELAATCNEVRLGGPQLLLPWHCCRPAALLAPLRYFGTLMPLWPRRSATRCISMTGRPYRRSGTS